MLRPVLFPLYLLISVVLVTPVAFAASFTPLGFLAGNSSEALGISSDGSTVVGRSTQLVDPVEAFAWDAINGMQGLGTLPLPNIGGLSYATAASTDGSVIVGYSDSDYMGAGGFDEAFIWDATNGLVGIGDLPGFTNDSQAYGVSGDGSVVVGFSQSSMGATAFMWDATNGMQALDVGFAYAISEDGSTIAGQSSDPGLGTQAFLWFVSGGAVTGTMGLGVLPGGTFHSAEALAISSDGSTVVGQSDSTPGRQAFLWNATDGMQGLGDLPGGNFLSGAKAVSADGKTVVGNSAGFPGLPGTLQGSVFVWRPQYGMESLQELLVAQGVDMTGWRLLDATGISADGLSISGFGRNPNGDTEAFVATIDPPPPFCGLGDLTGGWEVTITEVSNNCGEPVAPPVTFMSDLTQTGSSLSFGATGIVGTLVGESMDLAWSEVEVEGTTSYSGSLAITEVDCTSTTAPLEAAGAVSWTYVEPGFTCSGVDQIVAVPEPSLRGLLATGVVALGWISRRRRAC